MKPIQSHFMNKIMDRTRHTFWEKVDRRAQDPVRFTVSQSIHYQLRKSVLGNQEWQPVKNRLR